MNLPNYERIYLKKLTIDDLSIVFSFSNNVSMILKVVIAVHQTKQKFV